MDINSIPQKPLEVIRELNIDKESPLWKAAEGMEANFLREMIKNMRKTVQESPEMENSPGYKTFRDMLDNHYADTAAKTQGIGLAELIVRQVLEMQEGHVPIRGPNVSQQK